jgi:hypothetical protein
VQVRSEKQFSRLAENEAASSLAKQYRGFTNVTFAALAIFAVGSFATSLIFILKLNTSTHGALLRAGVRPNVESSLRALLGTNLFFSMVALVATLALVILGGVRPDNPYARFQPTTVNKARTKLGLMDEAHIGWLCKVLNAVAMLCAFAVAVTGVAAATFCSAAPVGST